MHTVIRNKKAISPILATLLLIVIAVAAIVVTYAWIMTYMGGLQTDIRLSKENIRWYGTPTDSSRNRLDFTVRNVGATGTQIVKIYMGNLSGSLIDLTNFSDISSGKALSGESSLTIILTWPNSLSSSWESNKIYYFRIIPSQGQYLEIQERAPI